LRLSLGRDWAVWKIVVWLGLKFLGSDGHHGSTCRSNISRRSGWG
jgi:hypothetical protein